MVSTFVFLLTSRCNLNCDFCCTLPTEDIPAEEVKNIISNLSDTIERVVFTGGEPFLRHDLEELCSHARGNGFKTRIHTNGLLLPSDLSFVDEINLPLDGSTHEVHDSLRGEGHYDLIINCLKKFKGKKPFSVTTLCCNRNKDDILGIADLLEDYAPLSWKVFKYTPTGRGAHNAEHYLINEREFRSAISGIKTTFPSFFIGDIREAKTYEMYFKP